MLPLLALSVFANVAVIYYTPELRPMLTLAYWHDVAQFGRVLRLVHANHVDPQVARMDRLTDAALGGMLASLDPHSRYIPPRDMHDFPEATGADYASVAADVQMLRGRPTVVQPFDDDPRAGAGLQPGDVITQIDGTDTSTMAPREVAERLCGAAGSQVSVAVARSGGQQVRLRLHRAAVPESTVRDPSISPGGIAYVRIDSFGEGTGDDFRQALAGLDARGMRSLILDLRDNPGGLLSSALDVADALLPEGRKIVTLEPRPGRDPKTYRADADGTFANVPLVVLVNSRTASASEILAGALQDNHRATLVGDRTYGKGSVQDVYLLPGGGAVQTTTAHYVTPLGHAVDHIGIAPDILLPLTRGTFHQLQIQRYHYGDISAEKFRALFGFEPNIKDVQLGFAAHFLQKLDESRQVNVQALVVNDANDPA